MQPRGRPGPSHPPRRALSNCPLASSDPVPTARLQAPRGPGLRTASQQGYPPPPPSPGVPAPSTQPRACSFSATAQPGRAQATAGVCQEGLACPRARVVALSPGSPHTSTCALRLPWSIQEPTPQLGFQQQSRGPTGWLSTRGAAAHPTHAADTQTHQGQSQGKGRAGWGRLSGPSGREGDRPWSWRRGPPQGRRGSRGCGCCMGGAPGTQGTGGGRDGRSVSDSGHHLCRSPQVRNVREQSGDPRPCGASCPSSG